MIGTVVAAAVWALVAGLALSLVLGALVAGAIALLRPSAAARQGLWFVALLAAGLAPVAILAVMLVRGAVAPPPAATAAVHSRAVTRLTSPGGAAHHAPATGAARIAAPSGGIALRVPAPPELAPLVAGAIVAVWGLGALIGLAGLVRSLTRVRGLKLRSSPLEGAFATELPWLTSTDGREIYLRLSYETETPIAVGFRRPVILLPTEMATAAGLTSIEPLIMHEYAHLARYDDWSNLVQRTIERIFWFNPLIWILGRRIALEREVAADEAVVARTHDAKRYASTLWRMAQEMRMPEHVVVAPGAMLTRKQISVRIERLLDENPLGHRYAGAAAFAVIALAATGVAGLAAGAPPIVLAQNIAAEPVASPRVPATPAPHVAAAPAAHVAKPTVIALAPAATAQPAEAAPAPTAPPAPSAPERPHALPSALHILAETIPDADDMEHMGKQLSSDIQRNMSKLGDALGRHGVAMRADADHEPVTPELVERCVGCDFTRRDLPGIDLSGMSLVGDDFSKATLSRANFAHTTLQGVDFSRADLRAANFRAAKLTGVDFSRANLDGADLTDATLTGVDLSHASMKGAKTSGIRLRGSALP